MRYLTFPFDDCLRESLRAGELLCVSGTVATLRDAGHRMIAETGKPPFDISIPVYYTGPSPAPPGFPCGACGPTTSARMEAFIPQMLTLGMTTAIGKGDMGARTRELFLEHRAVYLAALGGSGALSASRVRSRRVVAWEHLGTEALSLIDFDRLPVFVAWDLGGGSIFRRAK
jgi:fumarate hydratase subunit beta